MKTTTLLCTSTLFALASLPGFAQTETARPPSLTIYNQNFAVVRDTVSLDLKAGVTNVRFADTTAHVETDSVMLRDPSGKIALQILEQNYRNDPVSEALLLSLNEGKTIDFQTDLGGGQKKIVQGKIIRSGYVMHNQAAMQRYGQQYYRGHMGMVFSGGDGGPSQPIIEVDGKLQFSLPGQPIFPTLADDTILKPTLDWQIRTAKPAKLDAELAYVTGGMSWEADYNVVAPEKSDLVDITGWVTIDNQSGKTFKDAKIKLMAGDVSKIQRGEPMSRGFVNYGAKMDSDAAAPPVSEKAFDEYHLYTLERTSTLRDRETKQVEFVRATGVKSQRVYIYDGLKLDWNQYRGWSMENIRNNENYGTECNTKVAVMREFKNSEENHLGMPLPKGRVRFYKQDDGQPEFTGENVIDHTPKDETLRIFTGNAFDLVGERKRTNWKTSNNDHWADETFEIKLRNHKKEPVEIRVVEHLYRWINWEIVKPSEPFVKTAAQVMEFRVQLQPDEEKTITYTAHYTW